MTVTGDLLLVGLAQMGVVIAGFAGIAPALRRTEGIDAALDKLRLRGVVRIGMSIGLESVLPLVLYPSIGEERGTFLVASWLVTAWNLANSVLGQREVRRIYAGGRRRHPAIAISLMVGSIFFALNAIVFTSVSGYAAGICFQLGAAAMSFYSLVSERT